MMTRALAIETSGRIGSVAIVEDGLVIAQSTFPHGLRHAAAILSMIDGICREHTWKPADVRELYVSAGPGSFTGLRIGVTLAKTLAFATGAKIVAVPTARVLVENAPADAQHVAIVLDAKRDQIYTARYERDGASWIERQPAHLDTLANVIAASSRPLQLLGEGIPYHAKFIPTHDATVVVTPESLWQARATAVAKLGTAMAGRDEFTDPYRLTPIYIRIPEAEEKWRG